MVDNLDGVQSLPHSKTLMFDECMIEHIDHSLPFYEINLYFIYEHFRRAEW